MVIAHRSAVRNKHLGQMSRVPLKLGAGGDNLQRLHLVSARSFVVHSMALLKPYGPNGLCTSCASNVMRRAGMMMCKSKHSHCD